MIRVLFPDDGDVVVVTSDDLALDEETAIAHLHPAEAALIENASPGRRAEFAVTRACAREGLRRLGRPSAPILRGGRGSPLWPPAVVGTLSHCAGLRVAAVADAGTVRSIGLDVEPHGPLPAGVLRSVSLPGEARWVRHEESGPASPESTVPGAPIVYRDRLLFTAKEAVYKAWYPLTRRWLGFEDAELRFAFDPAPPRSSPQVVTGTFSASILVDPAVHDGGTPLDRLRGRWIAGASYVASAVVLRPDAHPVTDTVAG